MCEQIAANERCFAKTVCPFGVTEVAKLGNRLPPGEMSKEISGNAVSLWSEMHKAVIHFLNWFCRNFQLNLWYNSNDFLALRARVIFSNDTEEMPNDALLNLSKNQLSIFWLEMAAALKTAGRCRLPPWRLFLASSERAKKSDIDLFQRWLLWSREVVDVFYEHYLFLWNISAFFETKIDGWELSVGLKKNISKWRCFCKICSCSSLSH